VCAGRWARKAKATQSRNAVGAEFRDVFYADFLHVSADGFAFMTGRNEDLAVLLAPSMANHFTKRIFASLAIGKRLCALDRYAVPPQLGNEVLTANVVLGMNDGATVISDYKDFLRARWCACRSIGPFNLFANEAANGSLHDAVLR
jgi:hypothetical protein